MQQELKTTRLTGITAFNRINKISFSSQSPDSEKPLFFNIIDLENRIKLKIESPSNNKADELIKGCAQDYLISLLGIEDTDINVTQTSSKNKSNGELAESCYALSFEIATTKEYYSIEIPVDINFRPKVPKAKIDTRSSKLTFTVERAKKLSPEKQFITDLVKNNIEIHIKKAEQLLNQFSKQDISESAIRLFNLLNDTSGWLAINHPEIVLLNPDKRQEELEMLILALDPTSNISPESLFFHTLSRISETLNVVIDIKLYHENTAGEILINYLFNSEFIKKLDIFGGFGEVYGEDPFKQTANKIGHTPDYNYQIKVLAHTLSQFINYLGLIISQASESRNDKSIYFKKILSEILTLTTNQQKKCTDLKPDYWLNELLSSFKDITTYKTKIYNIQTSKLVISDMEILDSILYYSRPTYIIKIATDLVNAQEPEASITKTEVTESRLLDLVEEVPSLEQQALIDSTKKRPKFNHEEIVSMFDRTKISFEFKMTPANKSRIRIFESKFRLFHDLLQEAKYDLSAVLSNPKSKGGFGFERYTGQKHIYTFKLTDGIRCVIKYEDGIINVLSIDGHPK